MDLTQKAIIILLVLDLGIILLVYWIDRRRYMMNAKTDNRNDKFKSHKHAYDKINT